MADISLIISAYRGIIKAFVQSCVLCIKQVTYYTINANIARFLSIAWAAKRFLHGLMPVTGSRRLNCTGKMRAPGDVLDEPAGVCYSDQ
jgi:hypothetical protein